MDGEVRDRGEGNENVTDTINSYLRSILKNL